MRAQGPATRRGDRHRETAMAARGNPWIVVPRSNRGCWIRLQRRAAMMEALRERALAGRIQRGLGL